MAGIEEIEYVLPDKVLTNEELAELYQTWTADKIWKKTGIRSRHISGSGETALDLAERAAAKLFRNSRIKKEEVGFVILVTQSPDYILPSSACILQDRVGLGKETGAFDINLGCSGYVYGLAVAKALVEAGMAEKVMLVTADTYSKYIHPQDRSVRTIFGDGAAATVIGKRGFEICGFDLGTDGGGAGLLEIPAGGTRLPVSAGTGEEFKEDGNIRTRENLYMDGAGIFEFSIREVPKSVKRVLDREGMEKEDVGLFVFHQANQFMLDFLRKQMGINRERFYMNFSDTGNTVSSSIPIALKRAMEEGVLDGCKTVLLSGFGVGLSWGTVLLRGGKDGQGRISGYQDCRDRGGGADTEGSAGR